MIIRFYPLIASLLVMTAAAAHAEPSHQEGLSPKAMHEKIKSMSDQERTAFFAERKAQWDAMSKQEKLVEIDKRRSERIKYMEDRWNHMSDDEKIAHVEKRMQHFNEHGGRRHCMKKGDHPEGAPTSHPEPAAH